MLNFFKKKDSLNAEKIEESDILYIEPIEKIPLYNLIFHFHCIDHEKIWYALDKLDEHIDKFTGVKIFTLSSPNNNFINNSIFEAIVNRFKKHKDTYFIPVINSLDTRETSHFFNYAMPLLILLADMPDKKSYTLYAHSKGCTKEEKDYAITCWVNTLYKYNLDLFDTVIKPNLLLNYYKFIGCLKTKVGSSLGAQYHYAGTFFWFDSDIVRYNWQQYKKHMLGLEMWPNTLVHESDMLSVFDLPLDTNRNENYYKTDYWYNQVFNKNIDQPYTFKKSKTI